jgi:hypothetical protein
MNKYHRWIGYLFLVSFGLSMEMAATAGPQLHALGAGGYSGKGRRVAVAGNYAYLAGDDTGLHVIDVRDPAHCVRVGGYDTLPTTRGVALAGNYAYLADNDGAFQVIDVSDPANCVRVGGYDSYLTDHAEGVALAGNYAYVVDGLEGLQVIDVSDPSNCMWVSGWSIGTNIAKGVAVVGGRIYVAHRGGLLVLPSLANVQLTVRVDAVPGLDFTIQTATNLSEPITWTSVLTTNVATMPFDFVDFDVKTAEQPQKFYRVRQP